MCGGVAGWGSNSHCLRGRVSWYASGSDRGGCEVVGEDDVGTVPEFDADEDEGDAYHGD